MTQRRPLSRAVRRWPGTLGLVAVVLALLAGCATHAPPKVDEARVKQFAGHGYLTDDRYSIATTFSNWITEGYSFDIVWTTPVSSAKLPVVVYLPGLGESSTAGESWRTAWAQAGYAVLSVQLLNDDQAIWSSSAARRGDFAVVARERYAKATATARLKALAALLAELQRRRAGNEALLQRLDLSHVAISGFDVGAHTAMLVAGEALQGDAQAAALPVPVVAIVALSPHADFSGSALSARYQSIAGPVLSVTSNDDYDSLGVVTSPSVRKAPFEYMPSHDAYLLWLANATHAVISGSKSSAAEQSPEAAASDRGDSHGSSSGGSRRGGRRSGQERPTTAAGPPDAAGSGNGRPGRPSLTDQALNVSLIQGVTTAFLDLYLKQDATAREWLQKDARRWIGERGELKRK